jgi:hypothetical protein
LKNIKAALRREEKKLEKHLAKLQHQLSSVRAAASALGSKVEKEVRKVGKHSAAARARMSKAAKLRWKKIKAGAKKAGS